MVIILPSFLLYGSDGGESKARFHLLALVLVKI